MQAGGGQSDHETDRLLLLGQVAPAEILFEGHLAGHEVEQGRSHAQRRAGGGRDAEPGAGGESLLARVESEEIERVDVQVDPRQEGVEIVLVHAVRKDLDLDLGIDVARHARQDLGLGLADRRHHGPDLAIEIGDVETVEIGDVEAAHTQSRKGQQVHAADPAAAGNGDALAT